MSAASIPKIEHERLRHARNLMGRTQEQWARDLGISVFYIGKLERGERSPSGSLLGRFSALSGKPISWFYGEGEAAA